MLRVLCTVALLAGCKSDKAAPPSPSSGPAPAGAPASETPEPGAAQPGTSVRSARIAVDVPAPTAGTASAADPARQGRMPEASPDDRRKKVASLHAELDADHDGKVTLDELRRSPLARLDPATVDTDRDGAISLPELDAALAKATRPGSR